MDILSELDQCIHIYSIRNTHPRPAALVTKQLKIWVVANTSYLPPTARVIQRLYHIVNKTELAPTCKVCGAKVSWRVGLKDYSTFCSSKCAHIDPTLMERTKATNLKKYGVEHAIGAASVREKSVSTIKERYGVTNAFWATRSPDEFSKSEFMRKNPNADNIEQICALIESGLTQREIGDTLGITQPRVSHLLRHLGMSTTTPSKDSSTQRSIVSFVEALGVQCELNVRLIPPYDVDIYIPSLQLAIEVNGVYWHSELAGRTRSYHLTKTVMCAAQGIRLIQIYDTEWIKSRPMVESRLRHICGVPNTRIYARMCEVIELDESTATEFFKRTHAQKSSVSSCKVGLFYDGQLVAAMSFASPRYSSEQWELMRFSTELGVSVVGGASKLFSWFLRTHSPTSVVTYSDRRWNSGVVYQRMGFAYASNTPPNYRYFHRRGDTSTLLSRQQFQKHKLPTILDTFDGSLTEWENMQLNGYDRIWDCGSTKWIWSR